MTDEAAAPEGEEAEKGAEAPKSKMKLIIIAGAVVLLLVLGIVGFLFLSSGGEEPVDTAAEVAEIAESFYYDLPEMTVNLNSGEADEQFLKLAVSLEIADEAMVEIIAPRVTRVVDAFQVYLRELRRSDLDGSAGIYRLKEELRRRVNMAVYPAQVDSILFKEILVQ